MATELKFLIGYIVFISVITMTATVYDKIAAKNNPKHRVPENTLIYMGVLGGAAAEFIVMQIIRHKTKHKKFMIGLPVITVIHMVIIYFVIKPFI